MENQGIPDPLPVDRLYRHCDLSFLPFSDTTELEHLNNYFGQERAIDALQFGVNIDQRGYNIFVLGSVGVGKHQMVTEFIQQHASQCPSPRDWCYVNNFATPEQPKVLELPCGMGCQLQKDMAHCIEDLLATIPSVFHSTEYKTQVNEITEEYGEKEQRSIRELADKAKQQNIALLQTPTGYTLAPLVNDKVLTSKEFQDLPEAEQQRIQDAINQLKEELKVIVRQMPIWMKQGREQFKKLHREITQQTVDQIFSELEKKYAELPEVMTFLQEVKQDVIENVDEFRSEEESYLPENLKGQEQTFPMYTVNVLVDNTESEGAPVVYEDNPSLANLLGRVEHEAQFGTLTTNFTLIKAGALHKANHGYLILDATKLLTKPFAWEALKRALQSEKISIESVDQMLSLASTKSLEPEPVPLDFKVILLGDRIIYYLLQAYDPDFNLLFKVPADLTEDIQLTEDNVTCYARLIAALQGNNHLRPLNQTAVARIIEQSSRLIDDAEKLSLHLIELTDLLFQSDYFAGQDKADIISSDHVQRALDASEQRQNQFKEQLQESIVRDIHLIDTDGEKTAQINGLSVYQLGDYRFGQPTKITASARLGNGKVLDIEREAKLGGKLHSKAIMILSAFLANRYARNQPLPLSASLVFEQSYGGVEGDSASIAELSALISAIAGLPISQSLAVTGSINQLGDVQPIGGINQKIEGFFDICQARGLTGRQGVIMPRANVQHLMLGKRVTEAVEAGNFTIYAIDHIDQALSLLMKLPVGKADQQGVYPADSINGRVAAQIARWIKLNKQYASHNDGERQDEQ
jgi:lon-related putative ATP-dependent protease